MGAHARMRRAPVDRPESRVLTKRALETRLLDKERDMNQAIPEPPVLTWNEVFEADYQLSPKS